VKTKLEQEALQRFPSAPSFMIKDLIDALMYREPIGENGIMPTGPDSVNFPLVFVRDENDKSSYFIYVKSTNDLFKFLQNEIVSKALNKERAINKAKEAVRHEANINEILEAVKNSSHFLNAYKKEKEKFGEVVTQASFVEEEYVFNTVSLQGVSVKVTSKQELIDAINTGTHQFLPASCRRLSL